MHKKLQMVILCSIVLPGVFHAVKKMYNEQLVLAF